jgi:hypothetical protein
MMGVAARIGAIIAVLVLTVAALGWQVQQAAACQDVHPKTGDLNADGLTTSLDALAVLFYQAGMMTAPDDVWLGGADVNCDTDVNAIDATIILQVDAGLTTIRP